MHDLSVLLAESAGEVLENMFFSGVTGEMEEEPAGIRLGARVSFSGSLEGELIVSAAPATAAVLAAGFLGEEDYSVADSQVRSVVGELANVLCGVLLCHLDPNGSFVISPPQAKDSDGVSEISEMKFRKWFELMEGDLSVGLTVH